MSILGNFLWSLTVSNSKYESGGNSAICGKTSKKYLKLLMNYSNLFSGLAVALQSECQPETCTQMTATEQWIFLVSKIDLYNGKLMCYK